MRDQLLDAATDMICDKGWAAVTMARLGSAAGVSRQSVYNEVGSKERLAEALVMREFRSFLDVVDEQLCDAASPLDSVRRATAAVLGLGATSPLLRAIIESAHGANSALLPLLTTDSQPMIRAANAMIELRLAELYSDRLPVNEQLSIAVDTIVRLIFSYVLQPECIQPDPAPPNVQRADSAEAATVERVVWVAERLLNG